MQNYCWLSIIYYYIINNECLHINADNSRDKYYMCNECYTILCGTCKKNHGHQNSIALITQLNSQITFLFENSKLKIENIDSFETVYNNYEKLETGLSQLIDEFRFIQQKTKKEIGDYSFENTVTQFKKVMDDWNTLTNIKNNNNKEQGIVDVFFKHREEIRKIINLDKDILRFNSILEETMNNCFAILDKYSQERELNIEKYIMDKNSNLGTIVKQKFEKASSNLITKVNELEKEKKKLLQINEELTKEIEKEHLNQTNSSSNFTIHNITQIKENNHSSLIDFDQYKDNVYSLFGNYLAKTYMKEKHFKILDEYDLKSSIKMPYEKMISLINVPELSLQYYSSKDKLNDVINKEETNNIFSSSTYENWIKTLNIQLKEEFSEFLFEKINEIFSLSLFSNIIYKSYIINSKEKSTMKTIDLKKCEINDNDMNNILIIINNTKVSELFLQNNKLTDKGIIYFFNEIKEGNRLKNIYFNNNANITSFSIKSFKDCVEKNPKIFINLKIISFENNNCNDKISKDYMKEIKKKVKITMNI